MAVFRIENQSKDSHSSFQTSHSGVFQERFSTIVAAWLFHVSKSLPLYNFASITSGKLSLSITINTIRKRKQINYSSHDYIRKTNDYR